MSIIKGKTNVVAGFGGTKRNLGEVYFSQSSLATDNSGALPGWTGDYYENGKTLFPDLYNFVKAHSELQVTKTEYDNAISTYGECGKYVVDENGGQETEQIVPRYVWVDDSTISDDVPTVYVTKNRNPVVGDSVWRYNTETLGEQVTNFTNDTPDFTVSKVSGNTIIIRQEITATFSEEQADEGMVIVTSAGTSLRLPKYARSHGTVVLEKKPTSTDPTWYALYSDGWLEQGGYFANPQTIGTTAITETFWKPYATPPTLLFGNMSARNRAAYDSEHYPYDVTTTGFTHKNVQPEGQGTRWYSFGYAANTPLENILYPWIVAYTAAIPASVAQAAEFTGALAGKANMDLSNVPTGYDYVIEYLVNSDGSWYRKYKSGWLEQGGLVASTSGATGTVQTLLKPFANANYTLTATARGTFDRTFLITSKTETTFSCAYSSSAVGAYDWRAIGQGAN